MKAIKRSTSRPISEAFTCRRVRSTRWVSILTMVTMVAWGNGVPLLTPTVHAQFAPVGAGFNLNAGDLRFIFRQIQIAQAHSAGGALFGPGLNQVPELRVPFGLRTTDGSFNHLETGKTLFGASDQNFPRLTTQVLSPAEGGTSYTQLAGTVIDSEPRVISNLIVDQTATNPVALALSGGAPAEPLGTLPIGNTAPDAGLSAPFNSMFTFFGQFFDHGLDLVNKGGNGAVQIPLKADDSLFVIGASTNFMMLTRATVDINHEARNQTTPFVDQNQTYTSHASHQVFLREYVCGTSLTPPAICDAANPPLPTGKMLDGSSCAPRGTGIAGDDVCNIGNWTEVKRQAREKLGLRLTDAHLLDVPLLLTDAYGHFKPGATATNGLAGFPQVRRVAPACTTLFQGNPTPGLIAGAGRALTADRCLTNHQFLNDVAHNAVPTFTLAGALRPDTDLTAGGSLTPVTVPAGSYDNELLDLHFITGDGRGNENIALTAVHTVFHSEHNRLVADIDRLINLPSTGLTAPEVAAWKALDVPSGWGYGERLFQAAKFVTEMEYQHLVFEEFARKLAPSINPFIGDGINFVSGINPAILAEFAHQTYRLGHSMLTETIARTNEDGATNDIPLLDGFLNPKAFNDGGPCASGPACVGGRLQLTAAQATGSIFQGGTRQIGNEIDEFVTEAVRSRLVGLPLDLAVLNLARGRSEGVAPLNEVRRQLFLATGDSAVVPHLDWFDFKIAMRHPESLVNFIAAYGKNDVVLDAATTVAAKRARAETLSLDDAFMFQTAATSGVNDIDLWIGGLAEKPSPFGGLLGPTFNFVFEAQLENLQNADRFYYLERLDGLNLLSQLEANSFSELISRNTSLVGPPADIFSRPLLVFNMAAQLLPGADGCSPGTNGHCAIVDDLATPVNETLELIRMPNGTIRYNGPEHVVFNGRNDGNGDRLASSEGDDTMRGNGGNDVMDGGAGNDQHIGGAGDDILNDTFGDDVMKGGPGNDAIFGGAGPFDLLQGNEGNDFIVGGNDLTEAFGGEGNDIIYMGAGLSESIGGAGDDWMEGTVSPASIAIGDDNNQFQNDPNGGHDIFLAGPGDMDFDAEGGDDIMVGNILPTHRFEGMLGFDWVTYRGETQGVDADMLVTGFNAAPNELRDRFDLTEGLSGTSFNDLLRGDNRDAALLANDGITGIANGHVVNAAGIARIPGLAAILPAGATSWGNGNIILGGPGTDFIEGRGGDDIIDGDRWLNVQLLSAPGGRLADTLHALKADVAAGVINPGTISFVRSIVDTDDASDTAGFSGVRADYTILNPAVGVVTVDHNGGINGIDTLRNIESLRFCGLDGCFDDPSTALNEATNDVVVSAANPGPNGGGGVSVLSITPIVIGPVVAGSQLRTRNPAVRNVGTVAATITSVSLVPGPGRFTVSIGTCNVPVPVGGQCRLVVTYLPHLTAGQTQTRTIRVVSNPGAVVTNVTVTGSTQ